MPVFEVYHATSVEQLDQIVGTGTFPRTTVAGRWLGAGTYFWIEDNVRALEYAMRQYPGHAGVVKTRIEPVRCLDLTTLGGSRFLSREFERFNARYVADGKTVPTNQGEDHFLDQLVIDSACGGRQQPFDSVKAYFAEGVPIYPGSALFMKSQAQIVVKDPRIIIGPTVDFTQIVAEEEPDG